MNSGAMKLLHKTQKGSEWLSEMTIRTVNSLCHSEIYSVIKFTFFEHINWPGVPRNADYLVMQYNLV